MKKVEPAVDMHNSKEHLVQKTHFIGCLRKKEPKVHHSLTTLQYSILWNFMTHLFYYKLLTSFLGSFSGKFDLLMLCGDIESNPGPRPNSGQSFSICHWNLNSIAAHNFSKISLLRAYNAIHNYDIICLSETYLNRDTLSDSDNLKIPGYELIRVDHTSNQKRRGICIYDKDFLPIKANNVSCLKECFKKNV